MMNTVADPGGPRCLALLTPVKTSQRKMAMPRRKFCDSSGPLGQISGSVTRLINNTVKEIVEDIIIDNLTISSQVQIYKPYFLVFILDVL